MHEVFLTRGDVQMASDEVKEKIHSIFNCVNLHSECHLRAQHMLEGKRLCAEQILFYEGYTGVRNWLMEMSQMMKGPAASLEIRYLDNLILNSIFTS